MQSRLLRLSASFLILLSIYTLPHQAALAETIKFGVLAPRGELKAQARWTALAEYLQAETGKQVSLVPLPPARVFNAASQQQVDFVLSHSPHTVQLQEKLGASILATLNTQAGPYFGGVIVASKESGIRSAEDLRGKKVMSLKFRAAAGAYIFQTYHLMNKGIDPHRDFAFLREGKKQDDLVLAVRNGLIDAAFVRTGLLEAMEREGKIKMDEFVVIDQQNDTDFSLRRSTTLYPEWCLSALPKVDAATTHKIKTAAMKLSAEHPAAQKARIKGFVEPVALDQIRQALHFLKISPFDNQT